MIKSKHSPKCVFLLLIVVPLFASILIWGLAFLLWLTQSIAIQFGYTFDITDNVKTAVVTFCGAVSVAAFALYGVSTQNLSAERRHRMDKDLELRKNICMEVSEAYAMQYQYLLKLASPCFDPKELQDSFSTHTKAFFKIHMVCTESTIEKMLDANEEWARLYCEIPDYFHQNELEAIDRLIYIQERAGSFLRKVADFNVVAREDLEIPFHDNNMYITIFSRSYEKIPALLTTLKQRKG